ncbi:MAG: polysaccharide deacetylase [Lachnospiraceae bacterium]|nr:polysaccharide deacetylase [Lachnospiraceae bacterium]
MDSLDQQKYNEYRKKRVKLLKRLIILVIGFFIVMPNIMCIVLFAKLNKTNKTLDNIYSKVSTLENIKAEQMANLNADADTDDASSLTKDVVLKVQTDAEEYAGYKRIYLTFDDGPSNNTNAILDVLDEYNSKATFFVIAKNGYEEEYNRIINDGHTLGLHSYSHVYKDVYSDEMGFKNDVNRIYDFVENVTGVTPKFYRFPGGSSNTIYKSDKNELFDYLDEMNLTYVDWNVASNDSTYGGLSANQIANNVLNGVEGLDDCVILMHDANDKSSTVEALRIIISSLQCEDNVIFLPITDSTISVKHISK